MRRLFLLVASVVLVDMTFYASITPLLPHYADDLGLSKSAAGILSAAYAAGTLVGSVPAGILAARAGVKPTLLAGLALLAVSSVAFAFAEDILLLDSARFVQGFGGACSWAGGLAWLTAAAPREKRGQLIGSALAAAVSGAMLGPALGGAAVAVGPEVVFGAIAVIAAGLFAWACVIPAVASDIRPSLRDLAAAARRPAVLAGFWLVALPALFVGTLDVLAPLRLDDLGAGGFLIGAVFLIAAGVEAALSPLVGRFSDRRGRLAPIRVGLAGAVVAAVLLPLPGSTLLLSLLVVATVTALAAFWAPGMALLSDASESAGVDQGFAFAVTNVAWAGGQVGGGAGGAALAEATVDAVPYGILALLCAVTLAAARARGRAPAAA